MSQSRRHVVVELGGHTLVLMPERTVHWASINALLVADLHLGKAAAFGAAGIPVPRGTIDADLARLEGALERTGARRLMILGDLVHARAGMDDHTREAFAAWRTRQIGLEVVLVRGNHDLAAGDPPISWGIECANEPLDVEGIALRHVPGGEGNAAGAAAGPTICGHVHPVVVMEGPARTRERAPCFWISSQELMLPAFGSFTGGRSVSVSPGDRVFAVGGEMVIEVPAAVARARGLRSRA